MTRTQLVTLLLSFLAAAPAAGIAMWSLARTAIELADPCATWGYPPEQPVSLHVGRDDPCREPSVHTETRTRAVVIAAIFPGGVLAAAILAVAGVAVSRRRMVYAAALGMLAETLVVFTIAPLTLIVGLSFLFLAGRVQPSS